MCEFETYHTEAAPKEAIRIAILTEAFTLKIHHLIKGRGCSLSKKNKSEQQAIARDLAFIFTRFRRKPLPCLDKESMLNAYNFLRGRPVKHTVTSLQIAKLASVDLQYGASKKSLEQKHKNFKPMIKGLRKPGNRLPLEHYGLLSSFNMLCYEHDITPWLNRHYENKDSATLILLTDIWNLVTNEMLETSTLAHRLKTDNP